MVASATAKVGGFRRALSESEIRSCENATKPKCVCRCGGALHGRGRIPEDAPRAAFEQLPADDKHHLPTRAEAKAIAKYRKRIRASHGYHRRFKTQGTFTRTFAAQPEPCPLCIEEGKPPSPILFTCRRCDLTLVEKGPGVFEHDLSSGESDWQRQAAAGHDPDPWKSYVPEHADEPHTDKGVD